MKHMILEYETNLLKELVRIIDHHLEEISNKSMEVEDADSYGYFDSAEHVTGLGFVACQTYMTAVYGYLKIEKHKALVLGPKHACGQTKAQIINHAANYWKHNSEFHFDKSKKRKMTIEDAFESVGFPVGTDYPLSGILTELAEPNCAAFEPVIKELELWKHELSKAA